MAAIITPTCALHTTGLYIRASVFYGVMKQRVKPYFENLTHMYEPTIGPRIITKLYETVDGGVIGAPRVSYLRLPRGQIHLVALIANKPTFFGEEIADAPHYEAEGIYDCQKLIGDYLIANFFTPERIAAGIATALLNFRAGQGKTFVAAYIASRVRGKVMYVTEKRPLASQAAADLSKALPGAKVQLWDGEEKEHDILVIVINSALNLPADMFSKYRLLLLDEAHMYCTSKRKRIFDVGAPIVLGFSATTEDRKDGGHVIMHRALVQKNDKIVRAEEIPGFEYDESSKFRVEVDVIKYHGPEEYSQALIHESTDRIFTPYMNDQFLKDPYRCALIIKEILKLYREGHHIYVFCEEVAPLTKIREAIIAQLSEDVVDAPELGIDTFTGKTKARQRDHLRDTARILLTTYGFSGTGMSIVRMTAMVMVTPRRSNMKQIIARITRKGGDVSITRKVVDIWDCQTALRRQMEDRQKGYDHYGAIVSMYGADWNEFEPAEPFHVEQKN